MSISKRSSSYNVEEDIHLCRVYLDISQNPIVGINQSKDRFWSRVELEYNSSLPPHITQSRPLRSLQSRFTLINASISKLRGCIRQVENLNPSGASEQDIIDRAKVLLCQDEKFKKGFKFDHVWPILKDSEKFGKDVQVELPDFHSQKAYSGSAHVDSPISDSPTSAYQGLSSFSLDINEDNASDSPSQRPIGIKKAKGKRKKEEDSSKIIASIMEEQRELAEVIRKGNEDRLKNYEIQRARMQSAEYCSDNTILAKDLSSIADPELREFFRNEQKRIMLKRSEQTSSAPYGRFFDDLGGSGSDLPDY